MLKKAGITITIASLVCVFLDCIVFTRVNIMGVRPDMIMVLCVTLGILTGHLRSQLICGGIGLLCDIFIAKLFGLNCAVYLLAGLISGMFFRKFYTDNVVFPALLTLALAFLREHIIAGAAAITGSSFNYGLLLITYILPCSVFTAVMCIPMFAILKPLLSQYGKFISEKHAGLL